ncbi:MAG: cytochrome c biogenesis protein CcsA [Chloroflexota bacterium]
MRTARIALMPLAAVMVAVDLVLIFAWVPTEQVMGIVQRIFYLHVPLAITGFVAFFLVAGASAVYLIRKNPRWDRLAFSAGEVGVVMMTLAIITGALWAKPVWGVWWVWDAQLTTTFILWVIYVGYLMVRAYAPTNERGRRWAAVVGIVGAVDIPLIYVAAELWRTLHPDKVIGPAADESSLESAMALTLLFSMLTFLVLFTWLLTERLALRRAEEALAALRAGEC